MDLPVHIHYLRPPDRVEVFHQRLLLDRREVKVTLAPAVPFDPPIRIQKEVVLERGSDVVWFTFPGAWHDIGRFHTGDGSFSGLYANILTPTVFRSGGHWETTDLFLDLWLAPGRDELLVLDRDEFDLAWKRNWITDDQARRALQEVERLQILFREGTWPPGVVEAWTRERALQVASETTQAAERRSRST